MRKNSPMPSFVVEQLDSGRHAVGVRTNGFFHPLYCDADGKISKEPLIPLVYKDKSTAYAVRDKIESAWIDIKEKERIARESN